MDVKLAVLGSKPAIRIRLFPAVTAAPERVKPPDAPAALQLCTCAIATMSPDPLLPLNYIVHGTEVSCEMTL